MGLKDEIKQNKPFQSAGQEATLAILKTADSIRRQILRAVSPFGLSGEQYNILRILRGAGPGGLPTLEVAARMVEQTPAITRLLDKLEGKGLAERSRSVSDRRQVYCRLTSAGRHMLDQLDQPVTQANQKLRNIPVADLRRLIAILEKIRESVA